MKTLLGLGIIIGILFICILIFWTLGIIYIFLNNSFSNVRVISYNMDNVNESGRKMIVIVCISAMILWIAAMIGNSL